MEAEQEALADQALNEFAAAYGLEMPAPEAAPTAEGAEADAAPQIKDMGPTVTEGEIGPCRSAGAEPQPDRGCR